MRTVTLARQDAFPILALDVAALLAGRLLSRNVALVVILATLRVESVRAHGDYLQHSRTNGRSISIMRKVMSVRI